MSTKSYCVSHLDDAELEGSLSRIVTDIRHRTAELLAHLGELDARRRYLAHGFGSMFTFCVEHLGFSEDEAAKRIHAARTARQHPAVFALVHAGALSLTAVNLIAPHLSADNEAELLDLARGKSKRTLEQLLAARFPRPDVVASLRKLPQPKLIATPSLALSLPSTPASASTLAELPVPASPACCASPALALSAPVSPLSASKRAVVEPLSAQSFRIQATLSREGRDALLQAQALLGRQVPGGDLGKVIEHALVHLCDELRQKKFCQRKRAKSLATQQPKVEAAGARHAPEHAASREVAHPARPTNPKPPAKPARAIPRAVRRAVAERDNYRCAYVSESGRRCESISELEFHHVRAYARGGPSTVDNLQLRCRLHNDYEATLDFGASFMTSRKGNKADAPPACVPVR